MNAYELAKYLATEKPDGISYRFAAGNAAIMLRQQADRIAELEKAKTLTDEEIVEIYNDILIHDKKSSIKFARAILRKAQEK